MKKITKRIATSKMRSNGLLVTIGLLALLSCRDFVEIDPPTNEIVGAAVYTNDGAATAALVGIYSELAARELGVGSGGLTYYGGLSSDEFLDFSNNVDQAQFFDNSLISTNTRIEALWNEFYATIFAANSVIEGLSRSSSISPDLNSQLRGEALLVRAFLHFYLVTLFGDIPYITTTDFRVNTNPARTLSAKVYENIITDLKDAQNLLADDYLSNGKRTRPNKTAASAMLARVFLYTKDWNNAEIHASNVISKSDAYSLENLNNVFLASSREAIWQLAPVKPQRNTAEAINFILTTSPKLITLTEGLLNSFESGDNRLAAWIGSFVNGTTTYNYPFKYKIQSSETVEEHYIVLRFAEQYLIRAEARAQMGDIDGSQSDLNMIRNRAGLGNTLATDQLSLLLAIEQERRIEFFAEWGHRWLDLKRTNRTEVILGPIKPNWQSTDALYPIPQVQILNSPNTLQNLGY